MTERKTRGRPSKIDLLPEEIKIQLNEMLRDGRLQQQEILDLVNQEIESAGLAQEKQLSRSGLNRYATRMEKKGAKIRELREVSSVWAAKMGDKPTNEVSKMLIEVVRTLAADLVFSSGEDGKPVDPKALNQIALAVQRIEAADAQSAKRELQIRKIFAEEAATKAEKVAKSIGLTKEGAALIRHEILGIA